MTNNKLKIARLVGIAFIVLGIVYWIVSFFMPNTYSNEKPNSNSVYSTNVTSKDIPESTSGSVTTVQKPVESVTVNQEKNSSINNSQNDVPVLDPLAPKDAENVKVPEGLQKPLKKSLYFS